ncbi:RasGEF domain-containing protein [Hamiltosporidium tvaerminnensis]|uniref:RasGEF domain-containing protein n=1 Tax=Hamiltosporidium tvaerminnensis TaxID=1176355 RepID=A0A4Q9L8W9_9MICR|nr:hypothetical protein LUQ84_003126 [Hamiltosporidium tvaerminnensis]TBU04193.1 RasGEF domain-containing protein [Hamiltosporidium tvaerminnensis]
MNEKVDNFMKYISVYCKYGETTIVPYKTFEELKNIKVDVNEEENDKKMDEEASKITFLWSTDILPLSRYQIILKKGVNESKWKLKMEKICQRTIMDFKSNSLAKILTIIDFEMVKSIQPSELLFYDGSKESESKCPTLSQLKSKNNCLKNYISYEISKNRNSIYKFLKISKKLLLLENYNSLNSILNGIRTHKLNSKELDSVSKVFDKCKTYFQIRQLLDICFQKKSFFIPPLEIILKDIEDSNRNKNSLIASKRFCKLIEFLILVQNQKFVKKINKKTEHFILNKMFVSRFYSAKRKKICSKKYEGSYFLFI